MKRLRIWWLKRKARRAWLRFDRAMSDSSCGYHLTMEVSPRARRAAWAFDATMDVLSKLDPTTPTIRISEGR